MKERIGKDSWRVPDGSSGTPATGHREERIGQDGSRRVRVSFPQCTGSSSVAGLYVTVFAFCCSKIL